MTTTSGQDGRVAFQGADAPTDALLTACVHCGLCLSSCPTYRETGLEAASPRGRIWLMKAVHDGRIGLESQVFQQQMSGCLNCRACEAVCPSGVQYGTLLEASRAQIEAGLYSWDGALESNAIEVHVHHLRKKLGDGVIRTLRGVGYCLAEPAAPGGGR